MWLALLVPIVHVVLAVDVADPNPPRATTLTWNRTCSTDEQCIGAASSELMCDSIVQRCVCLPGLDFVPELAQCRRCSRSTCPALECYRCTDLDRCVFDDSMVLCAGYEAIEFKYIIFMLFDFFFNVRSEYIRLRIRWSSTTEQIGTSIRIWCSRWLPLVSECSALRSRYACTDVCEAPASVEALTCSSRRCRSTATFAVRLRTSHRHI